MLGMQALLLGPPAPSSTAAAAAAAVASPPPTSSTSAPSLVGLSPLLLVAEELANHCQQAQGNADNTSGNFVASVAGINSPQQIVLSGHVEAMAKATTALTTSTKAGKSPSGYAVRRSLRLPVSAPFHSPIMGSAAKDIYSALEEKHVIAKPGLPLLAGVDATAKVDIDDVKAAIVDGITKPVRWAECVATLRRLVAEDGGGLAALNDGGGKRPVSAVSPPLPAAQATSPPSSSSSSFPLLRLLEIGTGTTLCGLSKATLQVMDGGGRAGDHDVRAVGTAAEIRSYLAHLERATGR
jgi:hypothetical protein